MNISKVLIENFKCFNEQFTLELRDGLNILVGDNESGKSTILEAIHLALSGWINGKYLGTELTESLFNTKAVEDYLDSLSTPTRLAPPHILIEVFFSLEDDSLKALYEGNDNSTKAKACGIRLKIEFDSKYQSEYDILLNSGSEMTSLPIEYYDFSWSSFSREDRLTPKTIPIKSALIDSTNTRYQNGSDIYISRIIRDLLSEEHKIKEPQAHRKMKDAFAKEEAILEINKQLKQNVVSDKKVELSVDLSTKMAWEASLTTYIDNIPFNFAGKGEQCLIKTKLALSHKKSQEANILLLEEPENHLSHSKLNALIKHIKDNHGEKQILVSTHSSFVANKLGLESLILLNTGYSNGKRNKIRITDLDPETVKFFERLPGYNTLRLILCKKAILVEGPSDELIVQKAYLINKGCLPIEDEVDVISVGTAFLRFLEIAEKIEKLTVVVTDNDANFDNKIVKKYAPYAGVACIKICADTDINFPTLEPQVVEANKSNLKELRDVLGISEAEYPDAKSISDYMEGKKTEVALKIFDTEKDIQFPKYILDAIN